MFEVFYSRHDYISHESMANRQWLKYKRPFAGPASMPLTHPWFSLAEQDLTRQASPRLGGSLPTDADGV